MRPRKLAQPDEDALLRKINQRKLLSDRALCLEYSISRATLRAAVNRASQRESAMRARAVEAISEFLP